MAEEIILWDNVKANVNLHDSDSASHAVKGEQYKLPLRCLEIYLNTKKTKNSDLKLNLTLNQKNNTCYIPLSDHFFVPIGEKIYQPPFLWSDIDPSYIVSNFIYTTNAIYRILKNLERQELIPESKIQKLLDEACKTICSIYKFRDHFVIKHINNNINMSLITKVLELNLGKSLFNNESQEPTLTLISLYRTLEEISQYSALSVLQLMAVAIGRGRVFYKNSVRNENNSSSVHNMDDEIQTYKYIESSLAIDHRHSLIERISSANNRGEVITMCVILDDTSESILDLLWIQKLIVENKFLRVNLILNKAQVSINFSSDKFKLVLNNPVFSEIASRVDREVKVHEILFPLISFQPNLFDPISLEIINESDFLFVKGLNFFETFQLIDKDIYYAFIVSSSVSELYTGLKLGDALFAFVPANKMGYQHNDDIKKIEPLIKIIA